MTDTTYTCPMHPEIRQQTGGTCPKCGMKLVPAVPKRLDERTTARAELPVGDVTRRVPR